MNTELMEAVERMDGSLGDWGICRDQWQTIRHALRDLEAENARLRSQAYAHRDGRIRALERLATANALLRECVHFIDYGGAADDDLAEKVDAHLQGAGNED